VRLNDAERKKQANEELERRQREHVQAQAFVRFLTVRELRKALEPNLTGEQLDMCSIRISVRSALLAIRKLGLAPALFRAHNPSMFPRLKNREDFVIFPGAPRRSNKSGAEGWECRISDKTDSSPSPEYMGIGFDMNGGSRIAAVEPESLFAGEFPRDWVESWDRGDPITLEGFLGGRNRDLLR